jgi:hypothetical protein
MRNGHLGIVVAAAAIVLIAGARNAGTAAEARGVLAKHEIAVPALPNALCNDGSMPATPSA